MAPFEVPRAATKQEIDDILGRKTSEKEEMAAALTRILRKDEQALAVLPYTEESYNTARNKSAVIRPLIKKELEGTEIYSRIKPDSGSGKNKKAKGNGYIIFSRTKIPKNTNK